MASLISHLVSFDTAGPVPKEMRGISSSSPTVTVGMSTKLYTSEMSLLRSLSVSPSSSHNSAKVLHVTLSEQRQLQVVADPNVIVWVKMRFFCGS